ncbi:MAG: hypothetical protein QM820_04820 [Minicystis sp.]
MRLPRRLRYGLVGLGLLAVWVVLTLVVEAHATRELVYAFVGAMESAFGEIGERSAIAFVLRSVEMLMMALIGATLAAPIGLAARAHARARLRATGRDPLAPLRRLLDARPWWLRLATWMPAAIGMALALGDPLGDAWAARFRALALVLTMPSAFAVTALVRRYLRLVAAPPARAEDLEAVAASADQLFFSAVAVTREARGLVAAFAVTTAGFLAALVALPVATPVNHGGALLATYAALAAAAAFAFRRASRIAVGLDGVLVTGTSRRRFFAYRDLESADVTVSGDIVLRARGRDLLRLQLAGDDAPRIASILQRITAGIERAHAQAGDGAQRFAEAASEKALAQAAHGRADYRGRAASREDLLTIVESPATTAEARAAAASALGRAANEDEKDRLRIAAGLCAEPAARAVLLRIAAGAPEEEEPLEELDEKPSVTSRARRLDAPR